MKYDSDPRNRPSIVNPDDFPYVSESNRSDKSMYPVSRNTPHAPRCNVENCNMPANPELWINVLRQGDGARITIYFCNAHDLEVLG